MPWRLNAALLPPTQPPSDSEPQFDAKACLTQLQQDYPDFIESLCAEIGVDPSDPTKLLEQQQLSSVFQAQERALPAPSADEAAMLWQRDPSLLDKSVSDTLQSETLQTIFRQRAFYELLSGQCAVTEKTRATNAQRSRTGNPFMQARQQSQATVLSWVPTALDILSLSFAAEQCSDSSPAMIAAANKIIDQLFTQILDVYQDRISTEEKVQSEITQILDDFRQRSTGESAAEGSPNT